MALPSRSYRLVSSPLPGVAVVEITTARDTGTYRVVRRAADVIGFCRDGSDIEYQADTWQNSCSRLAGQHGKVCKHTLVGRSLETRGII